MNNTIISGEIASDVYKQMLELQSSNHNTAVTLIVALFGILITFSFWWNWRGAKQFLKRELSQKFENEKASFIADIGSKIDENINLKFSLHEIKLKKVEVESYRSMALHSESYKDMSSCIFWWGRTLGCWIDMDNSKGIRKVVNILIDKIRNKKVTKINITTKDKDQILEIFQKIPEILSEEKNYLIKKIDELFEDKES